MDTELLKSLNQDELINMINKLRQEKDRKNEYYRKKYNDCQEQRLKRKEYSRRYYENNKDKVKLKQKEYYNKTKNLKSDIFCSKKSSL